MGSAEQDAGHFLAGKHIIVAGAGIAGLSLVRALHRKWSLGQKPPRITVYERRKKEEPAGKHGYTMTIRSDNMSGGMQALQSLGLLDAALDASITGQQGREMQLWNANWNTILKFNHEPSPPDGLPVHNMLITRSALLRLLMEALPDADVRWEVGCESATMLKNSRMRVILSNGMTDDCDLLIASDGSNSKIRASLRPQDTLDYAGVFSRSATARCSTGLAEPLKKEYGLVLGGQGSALFMSPVDDHTAVYSLSTRSAERRRHLRGTEAMVVKDHILAEARERGQPFMKHFKQLLEATDPETLAVFNFMDKQPIPHSEVADMPVVFIGDSSHAVSPFAGNGANMALMDGIDLAVELSKAIGLRDAIAAFDGKSIVRSKRAVDMSHWTITIAHSTGWRLFCWSWLLRLLNFFMHLTG